MLCGSIFGCVCNDVVDVGSIGAMKERMGLEDVFQVCFEGVGYLVWFCNAHVVH